VPVFLADLYFRSFNQSLAQQTDAGPDPRDWDGEKWILMLGPLLGFGFLAGATLDLPETPNPSSRRLSRWLARRAVWVAIGPWWGFLVWLALFFAYLFAIEHFPLTHSSDPLESWRGTWMEWVLSWVLQIFFIGTLAYSWLWPAWAALRRAARIGRWGRALYQGLLAALSFVGSLFGSFWAISSVWRSYFFDARIMPLVALAIGLALISGCAAPPITYGEFRRRELFHAMLVAWVLGLALMWRWWSRRRPGSH
jgi:hypothetical protein